MTRSPDHPIDYLQPPLGYLLRIPCGDHAVDSPLDESAKARAEEAAAFLRFERIGRIYSVDRQAARDTAETVWLSCSPGFTDYICAGTAEIFCEWLLDQDRGLPGVFVADYAEMGLVMARLGVANVCAEEIVEPGGVISLHAHVAQPPSAGDTQVIARARTMVLDFTFTDLVRTIAWKETSPAC
jgi:hypothetical protein